MLVRWLSSEPAPARCQVVTRALIARIGPYTTPKSGNVDRAVALQHVDNGTIAQAINIYGNPDRAARPGGAVGGNGSAIICTGLRPFRVRSAGLRGGFIGFGTVVGVGTGEVAVDF